MSEEHHDDDRAYAPRDEQQDLSKPRVLVVSRIGTQGVRDHPCTHLHDFAALVFHDFLGLDHIAWLFRRMRRKQCIGYQRDRKDHIYQVTHFGTLW